MHPLLVRDTRACLCVPQKRIGLAFGPSQPMVIFRCLSLVSIRVLLCAPTCWRVLKCWAD